LAEVEFHATNLSHAGGAREWRGPRCRGRSCPPTRSAPEPPRDLRRLGQLSPATAARVLTVPRCMLSNSAGGTSPSGPSRRRLLNQSTHSRVANSTASMFCHGPLRRMTSVLNSPMTVSASALSCESPTLIQGRTNGVFAPQTGCEAVLVGRRGAARVGPGALRPCSRLSRVEQSRAGRQCGARLKRRTALTRNRAEAGR
jgi:hypothetical protein